MTHTRLRRLLRPALLVVGWLAPWAGCACAQTPPEPTPAESSQRPDETDAAIDRGLAFLLSKQRNDGAITEGQNDTALTSLAIMALASVGTTVAQQDARGTAMARAIDYVLGAKIQDADGYFGSYDASRMYGHGITCLMLTELHGMGTSAAQDARMAESADRAIQLILRAQDHPKNPPSRGGWRYTPDATDADLSVSIWQLMALRSAKNDGLEVPQEAIEKAIAYLRRSATSRLDGEDRPLQETCGFSYTPGSSDAQFGMTAAGLLAMQVCGQYDSPLVDAASRWLVEHPPKWEERYFFYGLYYYAQAMHQRGGSQAAESAQRVRELLLAHQHDDGAWRGTGEETSPGPVYATSMAVLSLSVKYHYLPIYQR